MMIWKISQRENRGYDTYSDAVVIALDLESARRTHPDGHNQWDEDKETWMSHWADDTGVVKLRPDELAAGEWSHIKNVAVELVGVAVGDAKPGVVCASFHAG